MALPCVFRLFGADLWRMQGWLFDVFLPCVNVFPAKPDSVMLFAFLGR